MEINSEQRDRLHQEVMLNLTGLSDLESNVDSGDLAAAQELRGRFEDAFKVLDEIGWGKHDERERFTLTPSPELTRSLRWHREHVAGCLEERSAFLADRELALEKARRAGRTAEYL
jgi:hypothetical protein